MRRRATRNRLISSVTYPRVGERVLVPHVERFGHDMENDMLFEDPADQVGLRAAGVNRNILAAMCLAFHRHRRFLHVIG